MSKNDINNNSTFFINKIINMEWKKIKSLKLIWQYYKFHFEISGKEDNDEQTENI